MFFSYLLRSLGDLPDWVLGVSISIQTLGSLSWRQEFTKENFVTINKCSCNKALFINLQIDFLCLHHLAFRSYKINLLCFTYVNFLMAKGAETVLIEHLFFSISFNSQHLLEKVLLSLFYRWGTEAQESC